MISNQNEAEIKSGIQRISRDIWKVVSSVMFTGVCMAIPFYYNTNNRIDKLGEDVTRHEQMLNNKADSKEIVLINKQFDRIDNKLEHVIDLIITQNQNPKQK